MNIEILSIGLLVAIFIIATIQPINMGVLAFGCTFVLGSLIIGMKPADILRVFPPTCSSHWWPSPISLLSLRLTEPSIGLWNGLSGWFAGGSGGYPG